MPSAHSQPDSQDPGGGGDDTAQDGASNKDRTSSNASSNTTANSQDDGSAPLLMDNSAAPLFRDDSAAPLLLDDSTTPLLGGADGVHLVNGQTDPDKVSLGIGNGPVKPSDETLSLSKTSLTKTTPTKPMAVSKTSIRSKNSASLGFQAEEIIDVVHDIAQDIGFHSDPKTVILPAVTATALSKGNSQSNTPQSIKRRFTVTAAHGIPSSLQTSQNSVSRISHHSHQSHDHVPGVHFKQSISSVQKPELQNMEYHRLERQISEEFVIATDEVEPIPMEQLDQILMEVDENQQTVMSMGGQSCASVDTQDSAIFETSPLQCGNINFIRDVYQGMSGYQKKHYVSVPADTTPDQVTHFMARYWRLKNPKIVLSVISDIENYKPWKSQRLKDDFEKGIIKAANTTNMWIITNGIDGGIAKLIGDAVRQEKIQELNCDITGNGLSDSMPDLRRKRITVIGVVPKDSVAYGVFFDGTEGVQIKHNGQKPSTDLYELNPDHTHFIMTEDENRDTQLSSTRCIIEKQLQQKFGHKKHQLIRLMSVGDSEIPRESPGHDEDHFPQSLNGSSQNMIPVVGLLVQGSPRDIEHVLYYLHNKMPLVVLKGSGGLADVIGFAYGELLERGDDLDYQENFLKPELIKYLTRLYSSQFEENDPAKLTLRDKIIECARLAAESGDQANMTVVNIKGWGSSLKDLDKFILMALFKEKHEEGGQWRDQLQSDLQLAVDWNRPDLATEIFQQDFARARVDKQMFEKALLKKDREQLVELFLAQGVRVHKFLNHKKLKLLYEKAEDREFFLNVCMEQGLGISVFPDQPFESCFLSTQLNKLIFKLTGLTEFIKPYEMSLNYTGMYTGDPQVAERKAMSALMIWAVLMNRHKLAKTLWTKCDEPICIALVCSMICLKLSKYTMEQFQKTEIQNQSKEYGEMALGVLAICWNDSSIRAYNMLSKHHIDFNNKTIVEIAYDAEYTHFLAHPCCQKWLTKTFFGNLQVKELNWGLFRLPYWFKILASVFLIIPMYIWISFIPPKKNTITDGEQEEEEKDEDESDDEEMGDALLDRTKSAFDVIFNRKKKENFGKRILRKTFSNGEKDVPFWQKIYLLWTAPITKFWTAQAFYFLYLAVFCLATLWPTCGNFYLDLVLWCWTAVILIELIFRVYMKHKKNRALSLVSNGLEIFLILVFLIALLLTRITTNWVILTNYVNAKTILCFGLIYFFYRLVGTYLLISPTLGPMIYKVNGMIKHDFVAFARMFLIFMIAGGVTIQAILYPNWPLTWEMIRRVITRPIYSMFLTPITDLDGDDSCTPLYQNSSGFCASRKVDGGPLQKCPYSSLSGYIINIQYLMICKLILVTLLYAMFSHTIQRIDKEASQIWKFQRYALIADLLQRFALPPPFTIFSVLILFVQYTYKKFKYWFCGCCEKKSLEDYKRRQSKVLSKPNQDDCNFWKQCAREFQANAQAELEKQMLPEKHGDILVNLSEDLKAHRKSMKRLGDRVVELERMVQSSRLYLEDIAHKLDKTDVKGITDVKGQFIHVAARQSPYPGTSLARFPVFDKYVPWELTYEVYDPKLYTLPKDAFPENEMPYVDEDIIDIIKQKEARVLLSEEELNQLPPLPVFRPKWNSVVTFKDDGDVPREINRRSWIDRDNQPLRYSLDPLGIPINPMGRTGIRGKGALWRWGPNHVIKAVITRWRRQPNPELVTSQSYVFVEGKRVLEFISIIITKEFFENLTEASSYLPAAVLLGDSNKYSSLCKVFMAYVLDQPDTEQTLKFDQSDMIQYFAQFANGTAPTTGSLSNIPPTTEALSTSQTDIAKHRLSGSHNTKTDSDQGFSAALIYQGYLDDPRNTDNAWVETEVWNFHYDLGDEFDLRLKADSDVKWKEISPTVNMFGNESAIVQETAKIHDAYH